MVGIEGKITWRKNLMKYKEYKELYGTKNFKMLTLFNTKILRNSNIIRTFALSI